MEDDAIRGKSKKQIITIKRTEIKLSTYTERAVERIIKAQLNNLQNTDIEKVQLLIFKKERSRGISGKDLDRN